MKNCQIDSKGTKRYYLNGQLHREDGPAVEYANGDKYWYLNDNLHREDGPAIEYANGTKEWYLNGKLHREDGPAVETANGSKFWYLNDKLHREDGPAIEYTNGDKSWYFHGKNLTEQEFLKQTKKMPECKVDSSGTKSYHLNGQLHREDGPAIEYADGEKHWYLNGQLHRVNGPAIEYAGGYKSWYLNGQLHRVNGPAVECADGYKSWYLNGKLHREDGPAIEYANGNKFWHLHDKELTEEEFLKQAKNSQIKIKKEDNTMSNQIINAFKKSAKKAPYRVARMQALTLGKAKILDFARNKMTTEGFHMFEGFLESDIGQGLLLSSIGILGPQIPKVGQDPRVQQLCEEFLDEGVAKGANEALTLVATLLAPALMSAVENLPSAQDVKEQVKSKVVRKKRTRVATKSRVSQHTKPVLAEEEIYDNAVISSTATAE